MNPASSLLASTAAESSPPASESSFTGSRIISAAAGDLASGISRTDKERLLRQRGLVIWLYGLSGAGKTTLADALASQLHASSRLALRLDGDTLRCGLCQGLGFTDADRHENVRRAAEVARLAVDTGLVVVCSFITPLNSMREMVRQVIGRDNLLEVHVRCAYATCASRDPKGLYARAEGNELPQFTGRDSCFEEPDSEPDLVLDSDTQSKNECSDLLWRKVLVKMHE